MQAMWFWRFRDDASSSAVATKNKICLLFAATCYVTKCIPFYFFFGIRVVFFLLLWWHWHFATTSSRSEFFCYARTAGAGQRCARTYHSLTTRKQLATECATENDNLQLREARNRLHTLLTTRHQNDEHERSKINSTAAAQRRKLNKTAVQVVQQDTTTRN